MVIVGEKDDTVETIKEAWPLPAMRSVYVSTHDDEVQGKLSHLGWNILLTGLLSALPRIRVGPLASYLTLPILSKILANGFLAIPKVFSFLLA